MCRTLRRVLLLALRPMALGPFALGLSALGLLVSVVGAEVPRPALRHLEHFGVDDGLAHSSVRAVEQDAEGYLWLATESYVQRFDGIEWRAFKHDPDDPHSLSESQVMSINLDRHGRLWLGTRNHGLNLWLPDLERFQRFEPLSDDPTSLAAGWIFQAAADSAGDMWIAGSQGLHHLSMESGVARRFEHDPNDDSSIGSNQVFSLSFDPSGRLWILHQTGLDRLDAPGSDKPTFVRFRHDPQDASSLPTDELGFLTHDAEGRLWIGSWDGRLSLYDEARDGFTTWDAKPADPLPQRSGGDGFRTMEVDADGNLWLGTTGRGLVFFNVKTERFAWYRHRDDGSRSLADDRVWTVHEDRSRVLWIGTEGGLSFQPRQRERFEVRRQGAAQGGLLDDTVSALWEDRSDRLWVGTMNGTVSVFDESTGDAAAHAWGSGADGGPKGFVRAFTESPDGDLWMATKDGLQVLPDGARELQPDASFRVVPMQGGFNDLVWAFDSLWLGGPDGLVWYSPKNDARRSFRVVDDGPRRQTANKIYAMLAEQEPVQDYGPGLWLATEGGFFHFDPAARRMTEIGSAPTRLEAGAEPQGPSSLNLVAVHRDAQGDFWLGSYGGGLNRWRPAGDSWTHFHEKDGLPSDKVVGILEQDDGHLWLATNGGLSRLDPETESFHNFSAQDGLHGNVSFIGTVLKRRSGRMALGGPGGLTVFHPDTIRDDPVAPELSWGRLYLSDELQEVAEDGFLPRSMAVTEALTLDHRRRSITLEPVALHFADPARNRYAYRLEGYDEQWVETDARHRRARYTNLPAGTYRFRFKAANKDGVWSAEEKSLTVKVLPPPWKTWWAYTLYGLILVTAVATYVRRQQRKLRHERDVNARLREVDRLKDELLSNTSHELRTPLQGILGLTESLLDGSRGQVDTEAGEDLQLILAGGRRLGMLVDDLLDFSKLEQAELKIRLRPVDLSSLVRVVLTLSRPLVDGNRLELVDEVPMDLPAVYGDEHRLVQILHNLVGNAIKFTSEGVVRVRASRIDAPRDEKEEPMVRIDVEDTGIGIAGRDLDIIFEPFRQLEGSDARRHGGTGLGLAVSRRLVELHGGELSVTSAPGKGSTFSVTLPLAPRDEAEKSGVYRVVKHEVFRAHVDSVDLPTPSPTKMPTVPVAPVRSDKKPAPVPSLVQDGRILVVDDEAINRRVLGSFLTAEGYDVRTAEGGEEALKLIADEPDAFDLVLLDIMMPHVSGYEVCRQARQWMSLEELPIIFLSAKIQPSDVVVGLAHGANDFLLKPISKAELLARIRPHLALLEIYRRLGDLVSEQIAQIRVLSGLFPMCSSCKSIRNDKGFWEDVESYLSQHSDAKFSHGLCPDCVRRHYGELSLDEPLM